MTKPTCYILIRLINLSIFATVPHMEYVPRRAMMYIPGSDVRKLQKIPSLGCDCAVLDMEDGVAQNRKEDARINIAKALSEVNRGGWGNVGHLRTFFQIFLIRFIFEILNYACDVAFLHGY